MFCGVYVQYLWHFTNVMNAADKEIPSEMSSIVHWNVNIRQLHICICYMTEVWQKAEKCATASVGNRWPAAARLMAPNYCCWDTGCRRLLAEWLRVASVDGCYRFRSFVMSEVARHHQGKSASKGTSTVFHVHLIKPPWLDQKSNLKKKLCSSLLDGSGPRFLRASLWCGRPFPAVTSATVDGVSNESLSNELDAFRSSPDSWGWMRVQVSKCVDVTEM